MNQYEEFIHISRYSRWLEDEKRRETWDETVDRFTNYLGEQRELNPELLKHLNNEIKQRNIMPSMRFLMTSGAALSRDNVAGYNCSYLPIDDVRAFDEAMYILLCGTGVGYSVERQDISKLPVVENFTDEVCNIVVMDSKEGWAIALRKVIEALYKGETPVWDTTLVRPAGTRLKTFGGRASGPQPLEELFQFCVDVFYHAQERQLNSLEVHSIMCKIGEVIVSGGVRRTALICLSNLSDQRMRNAKNGKWWETDPHFALANNSVAYTEKPDVGSFMTEWLSIYDSKSGERGIFNRVAATKKALEAGRDPSYPFGTNPCGEIILRPHQFCNLSEVVVRAEDTFEDLQAKVWDATLLGTIQSSFTHFPYLRDIWKTNTEEERLLGVSLTGIFDHPVMRGDYGWERLESWLTSLRNLAKQANKAMARELGINASVSITCVKPSGTVSQLVNSSSGIHPRHSEYYIRSVRGNNIDPVTQFMIDKGVPHEPSVTAPDTQTVFYFPIRSPKNSTGVPAIRMLELWAMYQKHWCDHNPSVTINIEDREWPSVGSWVFDNFDHIAGVSFLPKVDHIYKQAPYQECTLEKVQELEAAMPTLDWNELNKYELEDHTVGMSTMACSADGCEIVDLT